MPVRASSKYMVAAFLRKKRVQVYPYLADWLVKGCTRAQVEADVSLIRSTFNKLVPYDQHTKINAHAPSPKLEFIGAVLDSGQARAFLPRACFLTLWGIIEALKCYPHSMARNCLKLLEHMAAYTYVVQHARLHLRPLGLPPSSGQRGLTPFSATDHRLVQPSKST